MTELVMNWIGKRLLLTTILSSLAIRKTRKGVEIFHFQPTDPTDTTSRPNRTSAKILVSDYLGRVRRPSPCIIQHTADLHGATVIKASRKALPSAEFQKDIQRERIGETTRMVHEELEEKTLHFHQPADPKENGASYLTMSWQSLIKGRKWKVGSKCPRNQIELIKDLTASTQICV
jgi:hypothetical protein